MFAAEKFDYSKLFNPPNWGMYVARNPEGSVKAPHNALIKHMEVRVAGKQTGGRSNSLEITEKSLSACENHLKGNPVTHLKGLNMLNYMPLIATKKIKVRVKAPAKAA